MFYDLTTCYTIKPSITKKATVNKQVKLSPTRGPSQQRMSQTHLAQNNFLLNVSKRK